MPNSLTQYPGRGVDLMAVDLWSPPDKDSVISAPALTAHVADDPIRSLGLSMTYGDSLLDITQKIAVNAGVSGSYGGFSASVETKYSHSQETITKRHFAQISCQVTGSRLSILGGLATIKQNITPAFAAALKSATPDALFAQYGTHIAASIQVGGRADYFCSTTDITSMSETDFEATATAKYAGVGGSVEGHTSVTTQDQQKLQQVSGSESLFTIGGKPDLQAQISEKGGWAAWASSCQDTPGFISFDKDDGLVAIWDLADAPERKTELHQAYLRRAAKALRTRVMLTTSDPGDHPSATVSVPDGYKLLSGGAFDNWNPDNKGRDDAPEGNLLTASFSSGDNGWQANGKEHLKSSPASITAYAIVTYDPEDVWDVSQFESDWSGASNRPTATVRVPTGYTLIGGGAQVKYSGDGSLLTDSWPLDDGQTWSCKSKDHEAEDTTGQIKAYAIGIKCKVAGIGVQQSIQRNDGTDKANWPTLAASPRAGYTMTGGGAQVIYFGDGNMLTASYPKDASTWEARSKDHLRDDAATINVAAIGIKIIDA